MSNLVEVRNQQVVASSKQVAEHFGKRHDKLFFEIGRMYGELVADKKGVAQNGGHPMFYLNEYVHPQNKQTYQEYLMNRDGFALLVMGFTGKKALEWKLKYIEAFNQMEEKLKTPKLSPNPHYRTRMIKTAVKDLSETADVIAELFGVKKGMSTAAAMKMVGSAYGIDTAPLMPLLPAESTPSYMTPTAIAKRLGILNKKGNPDPKEVNRRLAEAGLQERRDKEWILTDKGKTYGEAKPYTNNGHSGYVINWYDTVLEVLPVAAGA